MRYKVLLFDLDGTLTDPQEGICKSINYALSFFGEERPLDSLTKYIGPPLLQSFQEILPLNDAQMAVVKYRERFSTIGLYENEIYPNVKDTLKTLKSLGYILCTASSKPQVFVEKILEYFDIAQYFTIIGGATLDGSVSDKDAVINLVLSQLEWDIKDVLMIGDTRFDLIGAEKIGIDAVGVTYGFAEKGELSQYKNVGIIDDIADIVNIVK